MRSVVRHPIMKEPKLTITLVPRSSFCRNLRSELPRSTWDAIRKKVYELANNKCEICGGQGNRHPVECHEVWDYDDENKIQHLNGFMALCPSCHLVKHAGRASVRGFWDEAMEQLAKVNKWSLENAEKYANKQFGVWFERSRHEWKIDFSLLKEKPYSDWLKGKKVPVLEKPGA